MRPASGDGDAVFASIDPAELAWIRDRLAGTPAPGNCEK